MSIINGSVPIARNTTNATGPERNTATNIEVVIELFIGAIIMIDTRAKNPRKNQTIAIKTIVIISGILTN